MPTVLQDLRYAARLAVRRPTLTLVTILTLAIGVGGNTAVFSVVNGLVLRPLPVAEPERLVRVFGATEERAFDVWSYPNATDVGTRATTLASLALHNQTFVAAGLGDATETAAVELVSGNYFSTMGIAPSMGRAILADDDRIESPQAVAVISDAWWRTRYGGSATAIGQTLHLNGTAFTVIGIAPPPFRGSYDALGTDVWVPLMMYATIRPRGLDIRSRGWGWLSATGRLERDVSIEQARAEVTAIAAALGREYDKSSRGLSATVVRAEPLPESMAPALRRVLVFALLVVTLALVAACANIANAQLAAVIQRQREIAVRLAVGASRGRVVRQWLTESVLLAVVATAAGLLVAVWARDGLLALRPPQPGLQNIEPNLALDWRVLGFAGLVAGAVTLLFGGWPAYRAARVEVTQPLKDEAGTTIGSRRRGVAQAALVSVQVAVSLTLLVSAGLLVRSLNLASAFDVGFPTTDLVLAHAETSGLGYSPERTRGYYRETAARLAAIPGVTAVTYALTVPLAEGRETRGVIIDGHIGRDGSPFISIDTNVVATNYFQVMGIPIVGGRAFTAADGDDTAPVVAIVNETMARRFWPNGDAVGQQLRLGQRTPPVSIVGIARDITYAQVGEPPLPYFYMPFGPVAAPSMTFQLRTAVAPETLAPILRRELREGDPRIRVPMAMSFEAARAMPLYPSRTMAAISTTFGVLALLLTIVGLYGVVMYSVNERTREFALRIALGASPSDILRGVIRRGVLMAVVGLALGAAGAILLARLLTGFLFGVSAIEPLAIVGWAAVVLGIAAVAAYLPARRATQIDPASALRAT